MRIIPFTVYPSGMEDALKNTKKTKNETQIGFFPILV